VSDRTVLAQIARLKRMPVAELRLEWRRLYGEETRSRNRDYLWKRLAWRVQELAYGGLDEATKQRLEELAPETYVRARRPNGFDPDRALAPAQPPPASKRDARLPTPGTVLTRSWHGNEIRVLVREDGYEHDGTMYGSLSALARAVTGQRWNGKLFFGLTTRKR
jgi:hypothetical protein